MNKTPYTLEVLEKLRKNSHLAKHTHFTAAKRGRSSHILVGIPVILINLLLSSVFSYQLVDNGNVFADAKWAFALLALIGACLGAIQTFFNFQKNYETHRALANRYLAVARECERVIASYLDGNIDLKEMDDYLKSLNKDYDKINVDAEAFPTSDRDYQRSLKIQLEKYGDSPSMLEQAGR